MRIAGPLGRTPRRARRRESAILFTVGPHTFSIAASAMHEICSADGLAGSAVPLEHPEVPKVRHTLRHRRKAYFVVDACAHFHLAPSRPAMLLVLRDARVAVLVNSIERMAEISLLHALPHAFQGEERLWYRGLAMLEGQVVPVVNPAAFLNEAELRLLTASAEDRARAAHAVDQGVAPA